MIFIVKLILGLYMAAPSLHAINYYWCEKDSDCVKAYGGCGRYLSVHRRYKELYEAKAHKSDKVASCLPPTEKDKIRKHEGVVTCYKGGCRLLMPDTPLPKSKKE